MKKVFLIAGGAFTFLFASVLFHGFFFATFFDPMFGLVVLVAWVIVGVVQARLFYNLGCNSTDKKDLETLEKD